MLNNIAFVFPGQGSQSVGMLADIAEKYPEIKQYYDKASHILNYDLWKLVQEGPASELDKTFHTQPALLVGSYAIYEILTNNHHIKPTILAGHSLGEYTALLCAQSVAFEDAIKLVAARGKYMQQAVARGDGAMAAIIGLDENNVKNICDQINKETNLIVAPANYNSIGQVVIAGHTKAVEAAITLAKQHHAKMAVILPVSVPSHCKLMAPAAKQLAILLEDLSIHKPTLPVINNVDVKEYTDASMIREGLIRQLISPVRWVETIHSMQQKGINTIIECGPGKILTGLNKRIDKQLKLYTTHDLMSLDAILAA